MKCWATCANPRTLMELGHGYLEGIVVPLLLAKLTMLSRRVCPYVTHWIHCDDNLWLRNSAPNIAQ